MIQNNQKLKRMEFDHTIIEWYEIPRSRLSDRLNGLFAKVDEIRRESIENGYETVETCEIYSMDDQLICIANLDWHKGRDGEAVRALYSFTEYFSGAGKGATIITASMNEHLYVENVEEEYFEIPDMLTKGDYQISNYGNVLHNGERVPVVYFADGPRVLLDGPARLTDTEDRRLYVAISDILKCVFRQQPMIDIKDADERIKSLKSILNNSHFVQVELKNNDVYDESIWMYEFADVDQMDMMCVYVDSITKEDNVNGDE